MPAPPPPPKLPPRPPARPPASEVVFESWPPPRKHSRLRKVGTVLGALAAVALSAVQGYRQLSELERTTGSKPAEHLPATPPAGPRKVPQPDSGEPTTDPGVIAARVTAENADRVAREQEARIAVLQQRVCLLERALRAAAADHVRIAAGKRGADARDDFLRDTDDWGSCFDKLERVQERRSLREAIDSALRR